MKKLLIFIFLSFTLTTFSQVKKIKIKKEVATSDTINIIGVWVARPINGATNRIWEFKADGTFIEKRGNDGTMYHNWPNGKYNLTSNKLDIFQTPSETKTYNLIYTVEKKKDHLLLTLTKESKDIGPGKQMKLTRKLE